MDVWFLHGTWMELTRTDCQIGSRQLFLLSDKESMIIGLKGPAHEHGKTLAKHLVAKNL